MAPRQTYPCTLLVVPYTHKDTVSPPQRSHTPLSRILIIADMIPCYHNIGIYYCSHFENYGCYHNIQSLGKGLRESV